MKRGITWEMVSSIVALLLLSYLYPWSARKLNLSFFLVDKTVLNFFALYFPSLVFFSSLHLEIDEVFGEVQRLVWYSLVPVFAHRIGWYGLSFNLAFPLCYAVSNVVIKPRFRKRFPIIVFNGISVLTLTIWRSL